MAKPKGTGTPSYDRINEGLAATAEFKEFEKTFLKSLGTVHVDGVHFKKLAESQRQDGLPSHYFNVSVGNDRVPDSSFEEPSAFRLSIDMLVTETTLSPVLAQFGQTGKVRTFNCRADLVKDKFLSYAKDLLSKKYQSQLAHATQRVADQARSLENSKQVEEARLAAYEAEAVDEIRSVLLKFRHVRQPAIKRAFQEFVVEDVTNY